MIRYTQPREKWFDTLITALAIREDFVSGEHDCATWVANTILSLQETLGLPQIDYFDFRGQYTTDQEGLAIAEARGGMEAVITSKLGDPIPVLWHLDGCIAFRGSTVGIMVGRNVCMVSDKDILSYPLTMQHKVWMLPGLHEVIPTP